MNPEHAELYRPLSNSVPRNFELRDESASTAGHHRQALSDKIETSTKAVLRELFELLEEYGPVWYTEELHIRARIALSDHH